MPLRYQVSLLASVTGLAAADHHEGDATGRMTCGAMKQLYKDAECCGTPNQEVDFMLVPNPAHRMFEDSTNPCAGQKEALTVPGMNNIPCFLDGVVNATEQSGADITAGFTGTLDTDVVPISTPYFKTALCPVNVHWHLGAEHRSEGEFDEQGTSPEHSDDPDRNPSTFFDETTRGNPSAGPGGTRYGYACRHYDASDARYDDSSYQWQHCSDMHVGETYEVHWPHSSLGACGTPYQYQYPFYDGVFCRGTAELLGSLDRQAIASNVGVQGQVFTIINDEQYYYPDLMRGMIVDDDHDMGVDVAIYTGSTTGTSRNNEECSAYVPITWQVDRKCHLISASTFDKMCADMKQVHDDMSADTHPHGARELVLTELTADNPGNLDNEDQVSRTGAR